MSVHRTGKIVTNAQPEPIAIDFAKTAILVVDMQNAFVSDGGYFDAIGIDISGTQKIIQPCAALIRVAREKGVKIVYLKMGFSPDPSSRQPADAPRFLRSKIPVLLKQRPELKDKLYICGTWGAEIIDALKPMPEDIVMWKYRHDGFIETDLDKTLKKAGIKFLLFVGTATNICVESTLRHAFFLDYFNVLVSDAVSPMGPGITQEATLLNVQSTFGWVTCSKNLLKVLHR
jgi:ureidoacrylate peracid hydrolase